ncbi:MAG: trypsin-like serine protease [Bacteroidales bacterium]|nr:trypsin-like serine protease [Bacteroidales bacterium]MCF8390215.1 trypsin-like serine protease [Bacteroidales bacterium]
MDIFAVLISWQKQNQIYPRMKLRIAISFLALLYGNCLFSQEVRLSIQLSVEQVVEWNICDDNSGTVISSEMFDKEESVEFFLPVNKHFYLNISLINPGNSDSIIFNLQIKGNDILSILDTKEGDLSLPFFTGNSGNQLKIVGGSDANIEDFPWQIYLKAGAYLCGGSIISEKWVLTAAHCTFDEDGKAIPLIRMSVKAGTAYPYGTATGKTYYVERVIVHEEYSPDDYFNDLALLELNDSIDFSVANYIELVTLDEINAGATNPGVLSTVTGWGLTSVDPAEFPDLLQMVQLPIVSNETVRPVWGTVHESVLMAGYSNGNKDACNGDSGGPLVVPVGKNFRLAGIVSWGDEDCSSYGGYTRISYFEDWIRNNSGVQRRFIPEEANGDSIICVSESTTSYTAVPVPDVNQYEWILSPSEAGILQTDNDKVEVKWTENYSGIAELGIRAYYENTFTEWKYKTIQRIKTTAITSQSPETSICTGSNIILSVNAEGRDLFYTWTKNGDFYSSGSGNLISFYSVNLSSTGTYSCKVDGICGSAISENIPLEILPSTKIRYQSEDITLVNGESSVIEMQSEGHELRYSWFKDGEKLIDENVSTFSIKDAIAGDIGNYNALVTGTCGSEMSDSVYVFVKAKSTEGTEKSDALLWPSIVEKELFVAVDSDDFYTIHIFDLYGHLVKTIPDCRYQTRISVEGLSSGTYILKLEAKMQFETFRFIVL